MKYRSKKTSRRLCSNIRQTTLRRPYLESFHHCSSPLHVQPQRYHLRAKDQPKILTKRLRMGPEDEDAREQEDRPTAEKA